MSNVTRQNEMLIVSGDLDIIGKPILGCSVAMSNR